MMAIRRSTLGPAALALALSLAASRAEAQNLFVALTAKNNAAAVMAIPAPGNGWNYSAAAPVGGDKWNRIRRPAGVDATDPAIRDGEKSGNGKTGRFPLGEFESVPLIDCLGNPTNARLAVSVNISALADDKLRFEPSVQAKSRNAVPVGLMEAAWRVYLEGNSLTFTISGLVAGKPYDLYVYGAASDPQSAENPSGDGTGGRFTLSLANVPDGAPAAAETTGGYYASLYTFNPEGGGMALTPPGTTWTKLRALADSGGAISFSTSRNSRRSHYVNGFQLIQAKP